MLKRTSYSLLKATEILFRRGNETELTYQLKWAAWNWLYNQAGCRAIGFEVSLEGPGGRIADAAGVGKDRQLFVIEIKSSRADFRRDDNDAGDESHLFERERALQRMAGVAREIADRSPDDHQATMDVALLERKIERHAVRASTFSTKFHDPRFLRIADFNYLMAPKALIRRSELPTMWGLLGPEPRVVVEAPRSRPSRSASVLAGILRSIARSNTRDMMRAHGVQWREFKAEFPPFAAIPEGNERSLTE